VLDECTSPLHDYQYTRTAMERTHRWASRSLAAFEPCRGTGQAIFGIVQGGAFKDLREESARFMSECAFDGYAIGGSLGRSKDEMHQVLEWVVPFLPQDRPRHLLGIGTVEDIFEVVSRGIDLFDCIAPTLMAGSGTVFTKAEEGTRMNLLNARYREDSAPIEERCGCPTCQNHSRAYLRHLFVTKEPTAQRLASIHNLYFLEALMKEIRRAITDARFQALRREWGK
ncbi:MAG: tRNA-guanine transglycosylase, partial [Desulfobacterales bacterium]|nr:tRNA-guanine transglycosylase [Desulfobacterales bacterium]